MAKKVWTWLVPLIVVIIILAIVIPLSLKKPAKKEVIKIGATLPITGSLAYKGSFERRGMEMAVDEINSRGGINGKKLQLIIEDNGGDASKAVTGVKKMIEVDDVSVILSSFTHISSAIAPIVIEKNRVLLYQSTISSLAKSSDNIFKDYYSMKDVGKAFAKAAHQEGIRDIGLLYPISEWGEDFKIGVEEEAEKLNINISIIETFDPSVTDLKTNILKIKEKGVDGIVTTGLEKHNIMLMRALNDLNFLDIKLFTIELLTQNINNDPTCIYVMNKTKAITSWYFFDPSSNDPKTKNFVENYKKRYNEEPTADAAYFYDDIYVLSEVLKICDQKNSLNSECIISELKKIKDYPGVAGSISFDNNGISNRPLKFFQFRDGIWKSYEIR
jgi:branched-chain amino acid transport system substrate-binding protein